MYKYSDKTYSTHEEVIDYGHPMRKIKTSGPFVAETIIENEKCLRRSSDNETLGICQALLLSTSMLLLSYHSLRYGQTEYSILFNGHIIQGYSPKAVVTLNLGYSVPYSMVSVLAIGMLAYSLAAKSPRWSLPSIILYLTDLIYDISGAIIAVWLFFAHFPLSSALSYTIGTILLIFGEIWIWLGVLRLYEHRTFK